MEQIQTVDIREYLTQKGISFKKAGGEIITHCLFSDCDKDSRKNEAHLYFSIETGQYHCKKCSAKGNIFTLAEHFGDKKSNVIVNSKESHKNNKGLKKSNFNSDWVEKYHQALPDRIKKYLNDRGITNDIINKYKLGWGSFYGKQWITIPIKNIDGNFIFLKLRQDPEKGNKKVTFPSGIKAQVYEWDILKSAKDKIVICEGELDMLVLTSRGMPAITSTHGAGTFKQKWVEKIGKFKKIYVCFDNDDAGRNGADRVVKMLGVTGSEIYLTTLPKEVGKGGDITDYFTKHNGNLDELLHKLSKQVLIIEKTEHLKETEENKQSEIIINRIKKLIHLFKDDLDEAYTKIKNKDHFEIWPIRRNRNFKLWVNRIGREVLGKTPSETAVKEIMSVLEGDAIFDGKTESLYNRMAFNKKEFWLDLADEKWRAIKITPDDWEVIENPPILFKRYQHQLPQVIPDKNGSIDLLNNFLNLKNKNHKLLIYVFVVTSFIQNIPHPCLIFHGPQGSAKTTSFKMIRSLIDPSRIEVTDLSNNKKELIQTLDHNCICFFDNLGNIKNDISDLLCRVITGSGFSQRMLYSDDTDIIRNIRRIVGLNGINLSATQPDLLERSIIIELNTIAEEERKNEEDLWQEFNELKPKILGGILNTLSKAMTIIPNIKIDCLPRMADFAKWGEAVSQALGYKEGSFIQIYRENIKEINLKGVEEDMVASAIVALLNSEESENRWEGTMLELLEDLTKVAMDNKIIIDEKDRYWVKQPNALSKKITKIKPLLVSMEIKITAKRTNKGRELTITNHTKNTVTTVINTGTKQKPVPNNNIEKKSGDDSDDNTLNIEKSKDEIKIDDIPF